MTGCWIRPAGERIRRISIERRPQTTTTAKNANALGGIAPAEGVVSFLLRRCYDSNPLIGPPK